MTSLARYSAPNLRRRTAAVAAAITVGVLGFTACSSSSSGSAGVPGGTAANDSASGVGAVNALIAAEAPADPSLISASPTASKIKSRGKLIVGGTQTAALFSLLDPTTGKVTGFDAAMSQLLAKYITGKPDTQLVTVTAATREALLKNHSVDTVFATYTITPKREKIVNFAGPYFLDGLAIEVKKSDTSVTSLKDLSGKTVVTESGSTAATVIKSAAPSAKVVLFDTNTEALQALQQGRADAYVLDQGLLAGNAVKNPDVKVLPGTFSQEPYGIGIPLDQADFKTFVNNWLQKVEADGTWAKVWKATLGTEVPGSVPTPPKIG